MAHLLVCTKTAFVFGNGSTLVVVPSNTVGRVLEQHLRDYRGRVHAFVDFNEWGRWLIPHQELQIIGKVGPLH